ncbi:hypothetical protein EKK58_10020 [Candidatus Dependentiae bacterium]|nr:MAG: hypothetical protein EKK58_10020 [Candidatus Dependentiae bacterium]
MRKLLIILALLIPSVAKAETSIIDLISRVPSLNQGVAFSLADSNINYLSTVDVAKYKGFNLEAGYAGVAKNTGDKLVAVLSYDLLNLKGKTTFPILDIVEFRPGLWAGVGRIGGSNEFDWGISATVLSLRF